jgi:hypothetical protein
VGLSLLSVSVLYYFFFIRDTSPADKERHEEPEDSQDDNVEV